MAGTAHVLERVRLFVAGADLTEQSRKATIGGEREAKDVTTYVPSGQVWTRHKGGLIGSKVEADLIWAAGDDGKPDNVAWSLGSHYAVSIGPEDADAGDVAFLTKALEDKGR